MKIGEGAPKIYARSRFVIDALDVGDGCLTKSLYESLLLSLKVVVEEGARVGDGEGLRGIEVGGLGQAEMLKFSRCRGGRAWEKRDSVG